MGWGGGKWRSSDSDSFPSQSSKDCRGQQLAPYSYAVYNLFIFRQSMTIYIFFYSSYLARFVLFLSLYMIIVVWPFFIKKLIIYLLLKKDGVCIYIYIYPWIKAHLFISWSCVTLIVIPMVTIMTIIIGNLTNQTLFIIKCPNIIINKMCMWRDSN